MAAATSLPTYPRSGQVGVVHLGLGAFHRAHQALVFDRLLQQGDNRWGVLGVAMRNEALAQRLASQDGLYAVQIASHAGDRWQVGGAIWQTCVAAREPDTVIQAIGAPSTRWVTLTVTEKGYSAELARLLVAGLTIRHRSNLPGLTVASCDNLSHNGDKLKALCLSAAKDDAALTAWIATACAFPNSMVDRIVPAATPQRARAAAVALGVNDQAALGTEAFWEWVIEDQFANPADAGLLRSAGVNVVQDVAPFEEAKLRMLNASHSAMAVIGAVAGLKVISDCIAKPVIRQFIHDLMTLDVGPQLNRSDWPQYRDALIERFGNPALQHSVHQIATDSSQKIPQRWVATVLHANALGKTSARLAFAAAAWMRYLRGVDDAGVLYGLNDPMAATLQSLSTARAADAQASVAALGTLVPIWSEALVADKTWLARVARELQRINSRGMLNALTELNTELGTL
jgi:fructuronate reductase